LTATANILSVALDHKLAISQASLEALATSPSLASGDMAMFHAQMQKVLNNFPDSDIILADATGQQIVNTYMPFGSALPKRSSHDSLHRIFETGRPCITNIFKGSVTGRYLVGVDVPVFQDAQVRYDLAMTFPVDQLSSLILQRGLPGEWAITILDRDKIIAARSRLPEEYIGKSASPHMMQVMAASQQGITDWVNIEGTPSTIVFQRSNTTQWTVVVDVPKAVMTRELRQWLQWVVISLGILVAIGLGLAIVISRIITRSVKDLIAPAIALGRGETVELGHFELAETSEVANALSDAADLLRKWKEKLRNSEAFLENIIEQSPIPTLIFDNEGMFIRTNHSFRERFSISDEELIGNYNILKDNQISEQGMMPQVEEVFNTGTTTRFVIEYDNSLIRNESPVNPKRAILDITVSGVVDSNGKLTHVVAQHLDITELKHQERMLIHQSRMAAMGEMLDNIAHQWKQPLNALNLLFYNIMDAYQYNQLDEACIDQTVADGNSLVQNMAATITDFSDFFRPDKEIKVFSVLDQIRKAEALVKSVFYKRNISIRVEAQQDLILSGFPNEYAHVLVNLFSNAKDAILKHDPSVSNVDVIVTTQDNQGCVKVRDTGGGIPENILNHIFDPYFTTKEKGSGIGLHMSKIIIESHMKGSISVKNIEGGAEFSVSIPLAK